MIAFYRNLEYRPHPLAPSPAGEGIYVPLSCGRGARGEGYKLC